MNVGRYLRGEDCHVGTARVSKEKQQNTLDTDPMDTPLPCDVKVGHVTIRKGVSLKTLVARMQVLYDIATTEQKQLTEQEIRSLALDVKKTQPAYYDQAFARAIEATHGIKE